jgi:hypothetical protein
MNLRARKSSVRRRKNKKNEKSLILYAGIYSFLLICLFSSVFGAALYFDGQSEKMNKRISTIDLNSYKLQREIQHLKIRLENLSRKDNIIFKIRQYHLGLQTPDPFQVVHLNVHGTNDYSGNKVVRRLAYNTR